MLIYDKDLRVAVVHDWLTDNGGAEKVLSAILDLFPSADIFTLVKSDKFHDAQIDKLKVTTSFIQRLPWASKYYRNYLPFFPVAVEQFDFSNYDLVLSSSYCVAKGVITGPDQLHISYCHSPMRYAWDLQFQYLKEAGLENSFKGKLTRLLLNKLRLWDYASSARVDHFISNSEFIKKRINKCYRRSSQVIYPPVDVDKFQLNEVKKSYYFTCSRLVQYKKIQLIVEAFNKMPDKRLVVAGTGPEFDKIKSIASSNIELLGYVEFKKLKRLMEQAKCFVFAAEEDFGIIPVEAQACGTPVIAYGKGGCLETVIDGVTGLFFYEQEVEAIAAAVSRFEDMRWDCHTIRNHSEKFSLNKFKSNFLSFVTDKYEKFK